MERAQEEKMLKVFGLYDIRSLGVSGEKSWVGDPTQGARGISGGQRRRLSLARSIACGARIMFCDEPTSGLSATDAEHVVRYLRLLSHKYSVLIIMSIHQPRREVARLFDELILLTSNPGRAVYQGPLSGLSEYAEKVGFVVPKQVNPTDRVMDLITPGTKSAREQDFIQYFSQKQQPILDEVVDAELRRERQTPMEILHAMREPLKVFGTLPTLRHSKYAVSFRRQLSVVAARQFRLRCRDKMHFLGDLAGAIAKALLFILAYYEIGKKGSPLQAGYFFFVLMASSIDQVKTMPKIISERTIMKLETSEALYSEWAYILPFTFMSMHVWFWSLMVNAVMESLYMMLSGIAKDATTAQVMSLPFLLLFMLYNGFTVTIQTCPKWLAWAIDISPVAYAMEAMTVAAAEYCVPDGPPCGQDGLYSAIVPHFGYKNRPKQALSVMCACMIIFRAVHVLALKFLNNIKR
ncbi:unnamed protein product [Effrenium voratum]|uniref:ABC transporter domain-containing protein n=1 Tax=Effrenium voratum TaxID=2562239 RepID=A0AA36MMA1_9DINO|nr:unnamed protein product [Effrenium voratum]